MEESNPTHIDPLLRKGNRSLATLKSLEPGLGTQLNTPTRLGQDVTAYRKAVEAYDGSHALRIKTLYPKQRKLDREAKQLISKTKNTLKPTFGSAWNERWTDAGFLAKTIATPSALSERITLLQRLAIFLQAHPEFEVEKLDVTAAKADELARNLTKIRQTLEKQETLEGNLATQMKTARTALEKRLRGLRHELSQLLADDDPRWSTFGYQSPAARQEARRQLHRARAKAGAESAELSA
jgi:hypothetical protein